MKRNFLRVHRPLFVVLCTFMISASSPAQWVQTNGPYGADIRSFAVSGTNFFAGAYGGVYLSTNNGTSWTSFNTAMEGLFTFNLVASGSNLLAGTQGSSVWRRPLSQTSVKELQKGELPKKFALEQNYPNPVNPTTEIQLSIDNPQLSRFLICSGGKWRCF